MTLLILDNVCSVSGCNEVFPEERELVLFILPVLRLVRPFNEIFINIFRLINLLKKKITFTNNDACI